MASGHVNRTNRPNTWLHRPTCKREEKPCQLGAVHTWQISLQKSPRRKAPCALAPNTSLNLEGDYADDRQRDQGDLTLTSHMRRTAEVAVRRAWPTCAGSERLLPA